MEEGISDKSHEFHSGLYSLNNCKEKKLHFYKQKQLFICIYTDVNRIPIKPDMEATNKQPEYVTNYIHTDYVK